MAAIALNMYQHGASATSTQIRTKVGEFGSCSNTDIPSGLIGCDNIVVGDIFDKAHIDIRSKFDPCLSG